MIHKADYVGGGVPLINPSHMLRGSIVHDPEIAISPEMAASLSSYALEAGDIVLARRGEVGRYAHITVKEAGWLCGTGSFFAKFHASCSRGFLGLMLEDPLLREHLQGESVGSTMTNLNQRILLETVLGIPPLAEQFRIVARVEELRRFCTDLRRRLMAARVVQGHLAGTLIETALETA